MLKDPHPKIKLLKRNLPEADRRYMPPDYKLHTDYDTLRSRYSRRLQLDLPAETIADGVITTRTARFRHNFDEFVFYTPHVRDYPIQYDDTSGTIYLNDIWFAPPGSYSSDGFFFARLAATLIDVYATKNEIVLRASRRYFAYPAPPPTSVNFTALSIIVDLEVTPNVIGREQNYLLVR